ncbi:MAG: catechol-2,3-dioxygenase [Gammaproteobacteria bacterium]
MADVAITLPEQAAWQQLEFLQREGIGFHRRINHGMTHSVYDSDPNGYGMGVLYELPRNVW